MSTDQINTESIHSKSISSTEKLIITGDVTWKYNVINSSIALPIPLAQLYFVDGTSTYITITLPPPEANELEGKNIIFRRRNNTQTIKFNTSTSILFGKQSKEPGTFTTITNSIFMTQFICDDQYWYQI